MAEPEGPGIVLTNKGEKEQLFSFYDNISNGDGTAVPNFDNPEPQVTLAPGESRWISLPGSFKGRVQRGTELPATWAEFQLCAANDGKAWGDISLQQGCDGAAIIRPTDGGTVEGGFSDDILSEAPEEACIEKDGQKVLQTTVGNWSSGPNQAAIDWGECCQWK